MPESNASCELDALQAEIVRLNKRIASLIRRAEVAEALAAHDVLTPVLNRRGFMDQLARTMAYSGRHQVPAVLIYLDMDGFKAINDHMGHAAGDAALIHVAELLLANVRGSDAVGRLGGDEFGIVLLNADLEAGQMKAEQMMARLGQAVFAYEGQAVVLGGSFGVRALEAHKDAEHWLAEADAAMWQTKRLRR